MKAYVLENIGNLIYKDVPVPELHSGWALVKTGAAGICGSDIPRIFKTGMYHFPAIPGHEFSGKVLEVSDKKDRGWIGRRVGVFPLIPCMKCSSCVTGQYEMCRNYDYLGSRRNGGFAEYVAVPVWNLIELPPDLGMREAAMLEPAAVALHAVRRLELQRADSAVLFGLGTIGILIVQWLRIFGVSKIFAVGHNQEHGNMMQKVAGQECVYKNIERNQSADRRQEQNAEAVSWVMEGTKGEGTAIAIDCAGDSDSIRNCLDCIKPGGQLLTVGNPKRDICLNQETYWKILRKQVRLAGTWNSSFWHNEEDDWHIVVRASCGGKLKVSDLITHCLDFDKLHQGLDIASGHEEYHNKVMIYNNDIV